MSPELFFDRAGRVCVVARVVLMEAIAVPYVNYAASIELQHSDRSIQGCARPLQRLRQPSAADREHVSRRMPLAIVWLALSLTWKDQSQL